LLRRFAPHVVASLLLLTLAGCARPHYVVHRRVTGTCEGACDYYMYCKRSEDSAIHEACLFECNEIFSTPDSLKAFERLDCEDALAYVEGPSGRAPGESIR
jgi:hypothetical protein